MCCVLQLLYTDRNTGVEYEYSIPNGTVQETGTHGYAWQYDEFSPCSVNCGGGGYKSRRVWCKSTRDQSPVSSDLCDPALEPVSNQHCGNTPCPPQWRTTEWSACSANCGDNGTQSREVDCIQINENEITVSYTDSRCPEGKPTHPGVHRELPAGPKAQNRVVEWRALAHGAPRAGKWTTSERIELRAKTSMSYALLWRHRGSDDFRTHRNLRAKNSMSYALLWRLEGSDDSRR
ncbi:papilin-like [Diaphorina citri]|uniref:Papilin-like n=1 Tax=Diaphorina citri TaxID=121845 RepID=A0A3Q0ILV8_DIACI|nr:papilin-like [Diaphorina citri]